MSFEDLVGVLRAADGEDPALAAATQLRVRRSLETRARGRHQLVGIATALAILFGGTVSWALVNGEVATLWAPAPEPAQRRAAPAEVVPRPVPRPRQALVAAPQPELPPETVPPHETASPPGPMPPRPPRRPIAPAVSQPVEVLYRRAHDLHFHGGDPAVTLAAWDAYLAAEPDGRFSVEARYNRALLLVRLARYAEARAALLPFARGDIAPAGYRQTEAEQLVERLARYE